MDSTIEGLHLLLTYRCDRECDHCFVWASPWATSTMTSDTVSTLLDQAEELGTVDTIYFEGGEPFMFYPLLLEGARAARSRGFEVGVVTNGFWGTSPSDVELWLRPFADLGICDLSVSDDELHRFSEDDSRARVCVEKAKEMGIPVGILETKKPAAWHEEYDVCFRGRAADKLAADLRRTPPESLGKCPEDLERPGRVHVDPLGFVHLCQGVVMGNVNEAGLVDIVRRYDCHAHPIAGPLAEGGPAELARRYGLPCASAYADACDLCYEARLLLRERFPEWLAPDEMYGASEGGDE